MALELQIPPLIDFDFNTGRESPSVDSRPSTPKRFGEVCFSCPTSPARGYDNSHVFIDDLSFSNYARGEVSTSSSLYNWDGRLWFSESPNRTDLKSPALHGRRVDEFEPVKSPLLSPQTTKLKNSERKKSLWSTFSPKRKKEMKSNPYQTVEKEETSTEVRGRGRGRIPCLADSRSGRRATRSLSPLRVSKYLWEEQQQQQEEEEEEKPAQNSKQASSSTKPPLSAKGSRKWKLRDFLLFRSASEGRASEKDPFRKYAEMYRKHHVRSPGSTPTDGSGSSAIPGPRKGKVSAHEIHYTVNKAISEDRKKKSFLPYKQGILGRLAVNPSVHALAYGYGSVPSSYG